MKSITLNLSENIAGDSNDSNLFPHKFLLTNTQVSNICKAFSSSNVKLSKTQLHKMGQSGEFLNRLLGPLLRTGLPLMENLLHPSAKKFTTIRINCSSISSRCSYL